MANVKQEIERLYLPESKLSCFSTALVCFANKTSRWIIEKRANLLQKMGNRGKFDAKGKNWKKFCKKERNPQKEREKTEWWIIEKRKSCRSLPSVIHAVETKSNSFQGLLNWAIHLYIWNLFEEKTASSIVLGPKNKPVLSVNLVCKQNFLESA